MGKKEGRREGREGEEGAGGGGTRVVPTTKEGVRALHLVVVVVDNDGGGIFSFLPQRDELSEGRFEQLFGTPHGVELCTLAAAHGVPAERVATRTGLQAAIAGALTRGGARVVVVETQRGANVDLHDELHAAVAAAWDRLAASG